jgi:RNA polymerase sigma factor (sigma-70 family)
MASQTHPAARTSAKPFMLSSSEVYRQCFAKLLRSLTARLRCADTATDIAQEAFARLLTASSAAVIHNPLGFLFRVAGNLAIDHCRAGDRALRQELGASAWESLPAADTAPDDMAYSHQCLDRLEEAIATLPPQCRRVFVLCKFEGYSHDEIAASLRISRSAVEKHVMHGTLLLRERLGDMVTADDAGPR